MLTGKFSGDHQKGYHDQSGGTKQGHNDQGQFYASNHEEGEGNKGQQFQEAKGHKKGSKTTGYHKVYHKDEYKKDHSFYDESDKRGQFSRYGDEAAHHSNEKGDHKEGGEW